MNYEQKIKLGQIIGIIGVGVLVSTLSLFDIVYPAIGDADFYNKAHQAMALLSWVRLGGIAMMIVGCLLIFI